VGKLKRLELTTLVGSPLGPYLIVEIEKLKEGNVYSCSKISSIHWAHIFSCSSYNA